MLRLFWIAMAVCLSEEIEMEMDGNGQMSVRDNREMKVKFRNEAQKPCDLHWMNANQLVWHGTLQPGEEININTYVGHRFTYTAKSYRRKLKTMEMSTEMTEYIFTQADATKFDGTGCIDRHEDCTAFARRDGSGCTQNPGWMSVNCANTCNQTNTELDFCELRDTKKRCTPSQLGYSKEFALEPGTLEKRFSTMVERFPELEPVPVLKDPWIMRFDNFLTDAECDALYNTVGPFERSTDTGAKNEHGEAGRVLSKGRTSSNAWCRHRCENHPDVRGLIRKIERVTGVPYVNYESFQVLQYESGQFYNTHHDRGHTSETDITGGRILTFFLYCSDVEEGGETEFPSLGIKVKPKRGRAILWPSVKNQAPTKTDHRTRHGALPVKRGNKLAANAWIHQHNFQVPNLWGCTGSFD